MSKNNEPAMGIPYTAATGGYSPAPPPMYPPPSHQPPPQYFHVADNPYQAGVVPPNAIVGDPKGVPVVQTIYRDTSAPFNCAFCGNSGLTNVKSKPSLAAVIACMMPFMLGCCFLCPFADCLWHKYHHCPNCGETVAEFKKSDPCAVMDPPNWVQESFALTS